MQEQLEKERLVREQNDKQREQQQKEREIEK